jgi:dimeric dUTPase (all-alpha-NTP-PPase superfamily)
MLQLQQQLNDNTNGTGWENGVTKNGKIIDWKRCAYLECAELIESYPWKHWKNIDASPDFENIKIESVDIWHFVMSLALQEYKNNSLGSIEKLAQDITQVSNYEEFKQPTTPTTKNNYEQIECVEELIKSLFCGDDTTTIIERFFAVAIQSSLNLDTLYKLYIGKNILNQFRQDHGYKDGTYIKVWNGKEDNVEMQTILETTPNITPKELYEKLESVYNTLT